MNSLTVLCFYDKIIKSGKRPGRGAEGFIQWFLKGFWTSILKVHMKKRTGYRQDCNAVMRIR